MTTKIAANFYLKKYLLEHAGSRYACYNPNNRRLDELAVIDGFNNGGSDQWYTGVLLVEDGTHLVWHVCSNEGYMPSDLRVLEGSRPDRHETFRKHYPDGYRMDFVPMRDTASHVGLASAYEKNQAQREETK